MSRTLLALAVLTLTATAGELRVPADHPDLASALAAAAPGDVIRVQTIADQALPSGAALQVTKPVTIVGEPVCHIEMKGAVFPPDGGLELAGPGSGEVVLVGVEIDYLVGFENGMPSLRGTGFDALRLYDCRIRHDNLTPTGAITEAFPAVDLTGVAELTVVASDLLGGRRYADFCVPTFVHGDGVAGIQAPGTSVLVVDSTVTGGDGGWSVEYWLPTCLPSLATLPGAGGPGIVADEVHTWGSTVLGGAGVDVYIDPIGFCSPSDFVYCGKKADGSPFLTTGTLASNACSRLTQPSPRVLAGGTWQMSWDPTAPGCIPDLTGCSGCPAFLFVEIAAPTAAPFDFAGSWVFLDPATAFLATAFPADLPKTVSLPVPAIPGLSGVELSAQVLVSTGALSGPVSGILLP